MTELRSSFLFTVRTSTGRQVNIGAAVDDHGNIALITGVDDEGRPRLAAVADDEPLRMSIHEATQLQLRIRHAVQEASMHQD